MAEKKVSVRGSAAARAGKALDKKLRATAGDSFVNFAQKLGIGADNALSSGTYGFNPITRQRVMLEWIHRGSWIGGVAVDVVADDMTRAGVSIEGGLKSEQIDEIGEAATELGIWNSINETVKWSRLYGGCIAVMLIDGQSTETPLRIETVNKDQFKGLLVLDRWMVEPSMEDLVTDMGPSMGLPKFYRVTADAPGLRAQKIHYSRCLRLEGIKLPYWQKIMENLWGLSVLERLYDRMIAFDSASTGAAQLVYKSYLRTMKVKDLREIVSSGGPALAGLTKYIEMMRRFQGIEGISLLDAEDDMTTEQHSAFSGLSDALLQFGQQISGSLQIPLVRLFGQSPAGLSSTGESDLRTYYDGILQQQEKELRVPGTKIYRMIAQSRGIALSKGFKIKFNSLWQLTDDQKSEIAGKVASAVSSVESGGIISRRVALEELKQSSEITGIFSSISQEDIDEAENDPPPSAQAVMGQEPGAPPQPGAENVEQPAQNKEEKPDA